jgi:hypothetical protein
VIRSGFVVVVFSYRFDVFFGGSIVDRRLVHPSKSGDSL